MKTKELKLKREVVWDVPLEIRIFYTLMTPLLIGLYLGVVFDCKEILIAVLTCYIIIYAFVSFVTIKLCREVYYISQNRKVFKLGRCK